MATRQIVKDTEDILRKKSRPVERIDDRVLALLDDMNETLTKADGAGLAAVQVGVLKRVVVIHVGEDELELINPRILSQSGEQETVEGCLSCPGKWGITKRPMKVKVEYLDRNGKKRTKTAEGLLAKAFCHEIDHLDGKLYYDESLVRFVTEEELEQLGS
ncbi:MAG: peptide deformylase [Clostridia bacterium]|nr:peptide deformylase [Clostridia bacterium]